MRVAEVVGAVTTVLLSVVFFYSLSGSPPVYRFWGENTQRLVAPGFMELARDIGGYMWGSLFPAFVAFGLVILTLALGLTALLVRDGKGGEE